MRYDFLCTSKGILIHFQGRQLCHIVLPTLEKGVVELESKQELIIVASLVKMQEKKITIIVASLVKMQEEKITVDPDQMLHSVASDMRLHCLQRLVCPST